MWSSGYRCQLFLLTAASMGAPQIRPRVFFVALRKDFAKKLPKIELSFDCEEVPFSITKKYWHIQENSIADRVLGIRWDHINAGEAHKERFNLVKPHPDRVCPTLVHACGNLGAASPVHPFQKRKLNLACTLT